MSTTAKRRSQYEITKRGDGNIIVRYFNQYTGSHETIRESIGSVSEARYIIHNEITRRIQLRKDSKETLLETVDAITRKRSRVKSS